MQTTEKIKTPEPQPAESLSESHCEAKDSADKKQKATQPAPFTFNDMNLKIGDKLHIKFSSIATKNCPKITEGNLIANLIGYYSNQSLLIHDPALPE